MAHSFTIDVDESFMEQFVTSEEPRVRRKRKSLAKSLQLSIFRRDDWLCFWCKRPVIFSPTFKLLESELKRAGFATLAYYHPHGTRRDAPLLDELGAAIDHVQAFSTGDACSEENFRTSCWKCNVRKSAAPLELEGTESCIVTRPLAT